MYVTVAFQFQYEMYDICTGIFLGYIKENEETRDLKHRWYIIYILSSMILKIFDI